MYMFIVKWCIFFPIYRYRVHLQHSYGIHERCTLYAVVMHLVPVGFDIAAFMKATYACILCFMWYIHFVFSNPIAMEYPCIRLWNFACTFVHACVRSSLFVLSNGNYFMCGWETRLTENGVHTIHNSTFSIWKFRKIICDTPKWNMCWWISSEHFIFTHLMHLVSNFHQSTHAERGTGRLCATTIREIATKKWNIEYSFPFKNYIWKCSNSSENKNEKCVSFCGYGIGINI